MGAHRFGYELLRELKLKDPRTEALVLDIRGNTIAIGVERKGHFRPVMGLAAPTPKFSKMKLFFWDEDDWQPMPFKDTPQALAQLLVGFLEPLWDPLEGGEAK